VKKVVLGLLGEDGARRLRRAYLSRTIARNTQLHEREMRALPQLVRPGAVVADIGANVGLYTTVLARLAGPQGKVYAFEPIDDNYQILLEVLRRAGLSTVAAKKLALGASTGTADMVIPTAEEMQGYYQAHLTSDRAEPGRIESVAVASIDSLYNRGEIGNLDFVKCDVEGAELGVLAGAERMLGRARPVLLIEVSRDTSGACFEFLHQRGYRGFVFDGTRCTPTTGYLDRQYSNYFFAHSASRAFRSVETLVVNVN
jgi:FkbM family methyltransferase